VRFRIGQGFDSHPFQAGRKLIIGGVEIAHEEGLAGHSDADVAAHALANAILGAIGQGDLGSHFPDSDPRYENADSLKLLAEVWKLASAERWRVVNADLTIIAQAPHLAPHVPAMRQRLAQAVGAEPGAINIKASSPEGLGALGRAEGIAAIAAVLLSAD
jgi:2-C-methyl-D-erythritol 2,4-cyclodiphosphate synthase